jgi:hypothetical protein
VFTNIRDDNTQEVINTISNWATANQMRLNVNKTKHMYINNNNGTKQTATINNTIIEEVDTYKWIGIQTNSKMDYDIQWDIVAKKTRPHIYLLKQL